MADTLERGYWLGEAGIPGIPLALVDGPHDDRAGVEKALYLIRGLGLAASGRRFVCCEVIETPVEAMAHDTDHQALGRCRSMIRRPMTDERQALVARLLAEAEWFGSRTWGDRGFREHGERATALMREAAAALEAPPAAPPADLVALTDALILSTNRRRALPHGVARVSAEYDEAQAYEALLKWTPAAPRVPETPQGWQPIETAPKDGTCINVWAKEGVRFPTVFWTDHDIEWWHVEDGKYGPYPLRGPSPTHWQPLPAPPQEPPR